MTSAMILTGREREVLSLVAEGWTQAQIAGLLFIMPKTVNAHVQHCSCKLGARNSANAVALALAAHAITPALEPL